MDQDTTGKSGSRSWRDRLGIDETRERGTEPKLDIRPEGDTPSRPAPQQSGPRVEARVVAKPAPMAPRPGTAQKAPPAPAAAPAASRPAAPVQAPSTKPEAAPVPQRAAQDDAFAERLRKHREAAEAAVKKRSTTASLDKFSFAKKEVETAQRESDEPAKAPQPAPVAPPAPQATAQPAPQPRPVVAQPQPQQPAQHQPAQGGMYQPQPGNRLPSPPVARQPAYPPAPPPRPVAPQQQPYRQPSPQQPPQVGGYGQQPYGHPQQQPAYRPQGPGYAPPPGAAPRRPAPPVPQGYGQAPSGQASRQVAPQHRPPSPQSYAPPPPRAPHGDDDLFEETGYRPAAPLGRTVPGDRPSAPSRNEFRADFDDPFTDNAPQAGYGGRSARDYSQAYREFDDDDYEDEPKRGWGGIIMLILALVAMGAVAIGLIYMYQSGKTTTGGDTGQVPTVAAPEQPAKAAPDAEATQQGQQPQGKKLIYERILGGDSANQPEQIVPREEIPIAPPPASEGGDSLPLPLPPPPQTQGSIDPGGTQEVVATSQRTDSQEGAAGVEPAASAVSRGPIANPPVPRRKPDNLQVASIQQPRASDPVPQVYQPPAPQPEVYQPPAPQSLDTLIQQSVQEEPVPQQAPQPAVTAPVRNVARDDDPLAGTRQPFNSQAQAQQSASPGPQSLQPVFQQQRQVALAPPPTPAPAPAPTQPVTSQDLQAFAPPAPSQSAPQASDTGYVIQLAAYRSEGEAMTQYQQLKARHANLVGNLPPSVQQTNLGASGTFYRLGMGPMQSKQAATELCNKLIAAGERDCLVRRR